MFLNLVRFVLFTSINETIIGDVPSIVTLEPPQWVLMLLPALGLFIFSSVVSALNEIIRKRDAEGVLVSKRLRFVASVLNVMAANHDKAAQQAKVVTTKVLP